MDLDGNVVVVTGGTRGVGAGVADAFLRAGATVVICARRPPDRKAPPGRPAPPDRPALADGSVPPDLLDPPVPADRLALPDSPAPADGSVPLDPPATADGSVPSGRPGSADARPLGAEFVPLDLRDPDAVEAFFADVVARYGRLDTLVNNAGGTPHRLLAEAGPARHARVIELNLIAPLTASLAAYPHLRAARGSLVMIGSVSGGRASPGTAAYGAAKAGVESLARSMAVEWAPEVRVNTVVPGMVRTELSALHYGDEDGVAAVGRTVPLGRLAEPAEIGEAAVFLASRRAGYISGASLLVHGGGERPAFLGAATADHRAPSPSRAESPESPVPAGRSADADHGTRPADKEK
ncbi:SDR family oxidoreductase [Streptomyces sp. NPDC020965]|uniref:SDR family oxidoreductase n=1 Tax=Streptomyces sp. NPDC020965 TaxID=3365105 RepID=UPI00379BB7BD